MNDSQTGQRHPIGLFDSHAKAVFTAAQMDAEKRGGKFLVSGLILYAAARADDELAGSLVKAMSTELDTLGQAVDAEWSSRNRFLQDQPFTLVNEVFQSVASELGPGQQPRLSTFLAKVLGYPDSMASRVVRRLGVEPTDVALHLASGG